MSREERGNKGTEVEEEALKAITQIFKTNAMRPFINQRWPNVWAALPLLSGAERIKSCRLLGHVSYRDEVRHRVVGLC